MLNMHARNTETAEKGKGERETKINHAHAVRLRVYARPPAALGTGLAQVAALRDQLDAARGDVAARDRRIHHLLLQEARLRDELTDMEVSHFRAAR